MRRMACGASIVALIVALMPVAMLFLADTRTRDAIAQSPALPNCASLTDPVNRVIHLSVSFDPSLIIVCDILFSGLGGI
jgi:hypothetical protein